VYQQLEVQPSLLQLLLTLVSVLPLQQLLLTLVSLLPLLLLLPLTDPGWMPTS
jgi:hypothetical protein